MAEDVAAPANLRESKFASLLVPIRDLAGNWGIDIANDLEEYLAHLNRTAFSFDGGPNLDFAEAALLIQSSACVYSKKVEYLHNLAYQALETVRCKKRPADGVEGGPEEGQEGGGPAQRGRNNDGDEDDSLEAFLTAGQDLKEAESKDLNLAREEDDSGAPGYVRAPAALLALEDQGGGGGDGDAGFYRLAQCHVHISGALFLDAMEADAYDAFLNSTGTGGAHAGVQAAMQQQLAGTSGQGGANATQNGNGDDNDDDDGGGGMGGDDDDDEDAAGVAGTAAAGAAAAAQHQDATDHQQQQPPGDGTHVAAAAAAAGGAVNGGAVGVGQPLGPVPVGAGEEERGEEEEEVYDAFKPLDMHSKGNLPIKPMQVRKPAKGKQLKPVAFAARKPSAADPAARAAAAAGLVHPEFAYGLQLLASNNCKPTKRAPAGHPTQLNHFLGQSVLDPGDAAAAAEALQDAGDAGLPDGEAAAAAAAAGVQGEGVEAPWDDDDGGAGGGDDGDDGGGFDALDLMHDIGGHRGASPWGDEGGGGEEGGSSYEDLCRAHIEAMVNAAAAQEVQSELAQRVSGWRTKIDPVLKDEEGRSNFDIQMYAERIIKRLQDATAHNAAEGSTSSSQHVAGFEAVAKEDVSYEVSRTFAAMLQLINNRNIELVKDSSDPDAPFRLQLLMDQLPHKRMAETLHGNIAEGQELASLQDAPEGGDAAAGGSQQAGSKRPPKKKVKNGAGA